MAKPALPGTSSDPPLAPDPGDKGPCIKGTGVQALIEDLGKMRADGRLPEELVERWLLPSDRELLERPVNVAGWYPIEAYRRLAELLCEVEGRREDFLRERGVAAARRLADAGVYQQMETAANMRQEAASAGDAAFRTYGQKLRLVCTLSGSLINFARFEVQIDEDHVDRYCIVVHGAEHMPDTLALATEGFINGMTQLGGGGERAWVLERTPERTRFCMTAPVGSGD